MPWDLILEIGGGIAFAILVFMLATPLFIHALVDDPDRPNKPYLFTFLPPGRIKTVIRGESVVRYMMNWGGHGFARGSSVKSKEDDAAKKKKSGFIKKIVSRVSEKNKERMLEGRDEFWDVKKGRDEPKLFRFTWNVFAWPLVLWAKYVRWMTGAYFVGIWPWQTLHMYDLRRWNLIQNKGGTFELRLMPEEKTDHVRAREFIFYIAVPEAETRDKVAVRVLISLRMQIVNPQKALFGVDRWDVAIINAVNSYTTAILRTMPLNEVLTATEETRYTVARRLQAINQTFEGGRKGKSEEDQPHDGESAQGTKERYGVEILEAQILDFNPLVSGDAKAKLIEPWSAEQDRLGTVTRSKGEAEGRAEILRRSQEVLEKIEDSELRSMLQRYYAQIETAQTENTTVFFGDGGHGSSDHMLSAIYERLQKLEATANQKGGPS